MQKHYLLIALKIAILTLALLFLFVRLREEDAILNLWSGLNTGKFSLSLLLGIVLLMPINWLIEALKWKLLTAGFENTTFSNALKAVLVGVFYTMFTPNRVGEGAGRFHYISKGNRSRATYGFLTGSAAQLLCTLIFGSIALILLPNYFVPDDADWWNVANWLRWPVWVITGIGILLYIEPGWNTLLQGYLNPDSWLGRRVLNLQRYSRKQKWILLALSAIRYGIFAYQFMLCLQLFGISLTADESFLRIAVVYLSTTLIPTFALAEIGLRESMALLILSPSAGSDTAVFAATMFVWVINLLLPALFGAILFLNFNPNK